MWSGGPCADIGQGVEILRIVWCGARQLLPGARTRSHLTEGRLGIVGWCFWRHEQGLRQWGTANNRPASLMQKGGSQAAPHVEIHSVCLWLVAYGWWSARAAFQADRSI